MPSVRVRRNTYIPLEDPSETNRGLAATFAPSQPTSTIPGPPSSSSLPEPRPTLEPPRPNNRPRASSRVDQHCQSLRLVATRSRSAPGEQHVHHQPSLDLQSLPSRTPSQKPGTNRIEGRQVDVSILSSHDAEPGLVGSALNLPAGNRPFEELRVDDIHHHDDVVEHLDAIDAEVATVSGLTNAANAIIFPPLNFYSRKPVVVLLDTDIPKTDAEGGEGFEDSLDRHVVSVLKRPARFKRTMRGIWSFLKTPLGMIAGIYGFLVVFWGAAIVFFLAKFINLHNANTQGFWVEVSSQVENGLFTVTGLGLLPSRVLDTYRIFKIWRYKHKTKLLRAKAALPQLYDVDDLPDPAYDPNYVYVLTDGEHLDLHKQQEKFQHSQTWYRPHGTETHRAFPINTALLICCLNDANSFFQLLLCGVMWGLNRFERPPWTTGTLIPCSFLCGIASAIFIWRGSQKTKRTKEVREKLSMVLHMRGPYSVSQAPVNVGIVPKEPAKTHGGSTYADHTSLTPEIEKRTEITDCMTIPASSEIP